MHFPFFNYWIAFESCFLWLAGIDFVRKTFDVDGAKVQLEIW